MEKKITFKDLEFEPFKHIGDWGETAFKELPNGQFIAVSRFYGSNYYNLTSSVINPIKTMQSERQVKDHLAYLQKL